MYLIIDIGNTLHKTAIFDEDGNMAELRRNQQLGTQELTQLFSDYHITHAILSSVGKYNQEIETVIRQYCPLLLLNAETPLPISIQYNNVSTLGPDRIANAVGASRLFPHHNVLSIQVGSCLVCDFINEKGEYLGGSISPGIDMRLKSLQHYTQKLPLIHKDKINYLIGQSTEQSILSGVMNGIAYEINGLIQQYTQDFKNLKVVITGGDAELLQNSINFTIFAAPNLVSLGLYEILRLYVEK